MNGHVKVIFIVVWVLSLPAARAATWQRDTVRISNRAQALEYISTEKKLKKSVYWPHVDPDVFLENIKTFTIEPLAFYEGKTTNFCAYSALTYVPLEYDPLGFAKFMIQFYKTGKGRIGETTFTPGKAVREAAGQLKYKGALDINPAGQMWFLALADRFKGYLNFLNLKFDDGDENTFWASTNFAKFNRMLRRLFPVRIDAVGADLLKPRVPDLTAYMAEHLRKGIVFVYINNKKLYKKTHTRGVISTPTHYIMLVDAKQLPDGNVEFVYWDYGSKSLQQLQPQFLKNIVYGITTSTFKTKL